MSPISNHTTFEQDGNIVLTPEKPTAVVVVLHGMTQSAKLWVDNNMAELTKGLPHAKFILPTAPTVPVTLKKGEHTTAWFDIQDPERVLVENAEGIDASRDRIVALIDKEVAAGTPPSRIALVGFSQGAALSMFTGFQSKTALAGVVAMFGFLPRPSAFELTSEMAKAPLLICHGDADEIVRPAISEATKKALVAAGVENVEFRMYPGLEHVTISEELEYVTKWLQHLLPEQQK